MHTEDINIFYLCKHVTPISVNIMLFKHANSSNMNSSYTKKHKIHKRGLKIIANGNNKNKKKGICHPDYWHLEDKAIFKTLFFCLRIKLTFLDLDNHQEQEKKMPKLYV